MPESAMDGHAIPVGLLADDGFVRAVHRAVGDKGFPGTIEGYFSQESDGVPREDVLPKVGSGFTEVSDARFSREDLLYATLFVRKVVGIETGTVLLNILGLEENVMNPHGAFAAITEDLEELFESIQSIAPLRRNSPARDLGYAPMADFVIDDVLAAAQRDGLECSRRAIAEALAGKSPEEFPEGTSERLVAQVVAYTRGTLAESPSCKAALADPLAAYRSAFGSAAEPSGDASWPPYRPLEFPWSMTYPPEWRETAQRACRFDRLFDVEAELDISVLVRCYEAFDDIWRIMPFPQWNGLSEWMLRMLCFENLGLGLLKFVPLSRYMLEWEFGMGPQGLVEVPIMEVYSQQAIPEFGNDSTAAFRQVFSFLDHGARRARAAADAYRAKLRQAEEAVAAAAWLNHRQRELLLGWIHDARIDVAVGEAAARFDVSLPTARADLRGLASRGLCRSAYDGKRESFKAAPDLLDQLA